MSKIGDNINGDNIKAAASKATENNTAAAVAKSQKLAQQQRMQAALAKSQAAQLGSGTAAAAAVAGIASADATQKAKTLEEKRELLSGMEITQKSEQLASQEEVLAQYSAQSELAKKATTLEEKRELLAEMDIEHRSQQVATPEELAAAKTLATTHASAKAEAQYQQGVNKAANAFGERFGESGATAFKEGVNAVRNGTPEVFAQEQLNSLDNTARTAAEQKYQQGLDQAANKMEERFGPEGSTAFKDGVQAVRDGNVDQFAAEQAANAEAKATDAAANKVEEKFGATAGQATRDGIDAVKSGNTAEFLQAQQAANKEKVQGAIDNKIGSEVKNLQDKVSQKLPPKVAAVVNEGIGKITANAAAAISTGAGGLFDKGASGLGDLLGSFKKGGGGGPVAGPPDKLAFAPNIVNKLVIGIGNVFSIQDIVDKLLEIEASNGYDAAHLASKQFNYGEICNMAHVGDPKNDPNIMPSRFMLIPGADDETLKANGNLNEAPWSIAKNSGKPELISVANLRRNLALEGFLDSGFTTEADATRVVTPMPATKPSAVPKPASRGKEYSYFDDILKADFFDFLKREKANTPLAPKKIEAKTYVVIKGDTLSEITKKHGYPNWDVILKANKGIIRNEKAIFPGQKILLPAIHIEDLSSWLKEKETKPEVNAKGSYYFPEKRCSDYLEILNFIAKGEGGYNSMNNGTKDGKIVHCTNDSRVHIGKKLTEMQIGEIMKSQEGSLDSGRKLFAVGRYQFIPSTLKFSTAKLNLEKEIIFSSECQDRLGIVLIEEKRPKLGACLNGIHDDKKAEMIYIAHHEGA